MAILVTGAGGFIGFHVVRHYLNQEEEVIGLDNMNSYYDKTLKYDRIKELDKIQRGSFVFHEIDLNDFDSLNHLFREREISLVVNLAAQAGVRYSIDHPEEYIQSNVNGFMNVLTCCKIHHVGHLVYASSSSVYGNSEKSILSVKDVVDSPISIYAATKKSNELMAHVYSHLFGLQTSGLRFFTVYGPWGRPDMSPHLFTESIFPLIIFFLIKVDEMIDLYLFNGFTVFVL